MDFAFIFWLISNWFIRPSGSNSYNKNKHHSSCCFLSMKRTGRSSLLRGAEQQSAKRKRPTTTAELQEIRLRPLQPLQPLQLIQPTQLIELKLSVVSPMESVPTEWQEKGAGRARNNN
jgi:hypothetical protein